MKKQVWKFALLFCFSCAVWILPTQANAQDELLSLLADVRVTPIFSGDTNTFTEAGTEFYAIQVPKLVQTTYADQEGPRPGERNEIVETVKTLLYQQTSQEFVSYSQMRPEVVDYFDDHLETLIAVLYDFCGLEKDVQLDGLTVYLLRQMPQLPEEMLQDIYTVYKNRMIGAGIDGTVLRSGQSLGLYYFAQTDPDWATYPFPNAAYEPEADDNMRNRSCGVMSMTMVASSYLHRELDPTELADYAVENGYRIAASGVDDTFMQVAASLYGLPQPDIYYQTPETGQEAIDWDYVRERVSNNALAIVHVYTGNFTSAQHYMVLEDYIEKDGTGYFLIADPYQLRSRYSSWDTDAMADPEMGDDGMILATPELVAQTCSAVILFEEDKTAWDVSCSSKANTGLPLGEAEGGNA